MKLLLVLFIATFTTSSWAMCMADSMAGDLESSFTDLVGEVEKITDQSFVTVMPFSVEHDGKGSFKLLLDDKGNLEAVKMDYTSKSGVKRFYTVSLAAFNNGETLDYTPKEFAGKAITFKKSSSLSPSTGGVFQLLIRTKLGNTPAEDKYKSANFELVKVNNKWEARYQGRKAKNVVLSPGVKVTWGGFAWNGTFGDYEVE